MTSRVDQSKPPRFEHCKLVGTQIVYLGHDGVFENKKDKAWNEFRAWDYLEKEGWELVSVVMDGEQQVAYFKRPAKV